MAWLCGGNGRFNEASQVRPRSPPHGTTSIIHLASPDSNITLDEATEGMSQCQLQAKQRQVVFFMFWAFFVC